MKERISFYLQKNNHIFGDCVLAVCYNATEEEIKEYGLTGENVLLLIKNSQLVNFIDKKNLNYYKELSKMFANKNIFLRIQCECLLGMYGDSHCDCEDQRLQSIKLISENDGIYVHLPQEAQGWGLFYKLKELELQVSGRTEKGKFIGKKNRDEAQSFLAGNTQFDDLRSYGIIYKIFNELGLMSEKFILISDSEKKYQALLKQGFNIQKLSDYHEEEVNVDNLSEYLIKILNNTHTYSENIIDKIIDLINRRKYNSRTLSTLTSIVDKINNDKSYDLDSKIKSKLLKTYNNIICGEEKKYIIDNSTVKIQNNFSCKVNSSIFKAIQNVYGNEVFDRISLEKLYYFEEKNDNSAIRIRSSKVLDTIGKGSIFMKGQIHVEQRDFNEDKTQILQKEISLSKLRAFFENNNYDYLKRVEMITMVSERRIPGINIYIKKLPNIECRIMDVFGKKEKIQEFINNIMTTLSRNVFNETISNMAYEDENFDGYNLRFADLETAINEELSIYEIMKKGD